MVGLLWTRFSSAVRQPLTSIHDDEWHFERHWEWLGAGRSEDLTYVNYKGARMEIYRLIWQHKHGPVPQGQFPRPACGWKECVSPHHLRLRRRLSRSEKLSPARKRECVSVARDGGVSEALATEFGVSVRRVYGLLEEARGTEDLGSLWK